MSGNRITIGLVGVANHGATILQAILSSPNLKLITCYDLNTAAMDRVIKDHNIRGVSSYDELIDDPSIDSVALVTPNHLHRDQAEKAARKGKHVFLEKPIANTVKDAKEIIAVLREAGCVLSVGHNARRKRTFRRAKAILKENRIGAIVGVEANLSRPAGLLVGLPPWKADPDTCPLLPMMQLGIHFVDTVRYLLGPIESVSSIAGQIAMKGEVYDSTAALLRLESGIPVALSSYYVSPDVYYIKIYGTNGILLCTNSRLRLETTANHIEYTVDEEDFSDEGMESYISEMTEFADCIINRTEPETGGVEAIEALAAVEAMSDSIKTGKSIRLKDILL
jgi:predicted dehydrogenase